MIKFDLDLPTEIIEPIQEGGIMDRIQTVADNTLSKFDVNQNEINTAEKNMIAAKENSDYSKWKARNDIGFKKAGEQIDRINKVLNKQTVNTSSIVARARNSVLQFPIYITHSILVDEAHLIAKMFERVYTTLVQTVLSQNDIIDEHEAENLVFLKRFHTNIQEATNVLVNKYYEPIDDMDKIMCESIFYKTQISDDLYVEFRVVPTVDEDLIMENARLSNEPLQGLFYLREASKDKNDKKPTKDSNARTVPERDVTEEMLADLVKKYNEIKPEEKHKTVEGFKAEIIGSIDGVDLGNNRTIMARKVRGKDGKPVKIKDKDGKDTGEYEYEYYIPKISSKEPPTPKIAKGVEVPQILKDSDIKKINGLLPYTVKVSFIMRTLGNKSDREVSYVIGIKSILHLISPKDLAEDLREIITGNIKSLQKVRYKTGEISFKDYYFNIKGLKADAAKHINYDKRWLNTLKRLGEYNKMHGTFMKAPIKLITGGHAPIPNGTLVLSQPNVVMLMNETGIDLSIVSNAKKLAKTLFLIAVVIIDSSARTMRVLFPDSDNDWDVQSMSSINAELNKTDNNDIMKELNRVLVNK